MSIAHENVKTRYQLIAQKNARLAEQANARAYAAAPELAKLAEELLQVNLAIMESGLNKSLDRQALVKKRDSLVSRQQAILQENGFKPDALAPKFDCAICEDTGITPDGVRCTCYNRYLLEERIKDSGLPENGGTFETFDSSIFSEEKGTEKNSQQQYMVALKANCEKFADEALSGSTRLLILTGNSGTGKSFLVQSIVSRLIKNGEVALYTTASNIFSLFHNHRLGENVDLDTYYDVPVLAIDDLGTEIMTKNVTIEYFYNLINEREARNKATVIATNLIAEQFLARYGDRIYSRLFSKASAKYRIPASYPDIRK